MNSVPKQKENGEVSAIERKESGWTRPFRVLLSLVMILMLVTVSGTLIALIVSASTRSATCMLAPASPSELLGAT